jgi:hypothetical protein
MILPDRRVSLSFSRCRFVGSAVGFKNRVRLKFNFLNRFNVIWVVQLYREKYFAFHGPQTSSNLSLSHPSEGRLENVTDAGVGCGRRGGGARRAPPIIRRRSCFGRLHAR